MGKFVKGAPQTSQPLVVGTKFFTVPWTNVLVGGGFRLGRQSMISALKASLKRMDRQQVDLWQVSPVQPMHHACCIVHRQQCTPPPPNVANRAKATHNLGMQALSHTQASFCKLCTCYIAKGCILLIQACPHCRQHCSQHSGMHTAAYTCIRTDMHTTQAVLLPTYSISVIGLLPVDCSAFWTSRRLVHHKTLG